MSEEKLKKLKSVEDEVRKLVDGSLTQTLTGASSASAMPDLKKAVLYLYLHASGWNLEKCQRVRRDELAKIGKK